MADAGIDDILVTFNLVGAAKLERLRGAAPARRCHRQRRRRAAPPGARGRGRRHAELGVLVDCDTGYRRTGVATPRGGGRVGGRGRANGRAPLRGVPDLPGPAGRRGVPAGGRRTGRAGRPRAEVVSAGGTPTMWASGELRPTVTEYRVGTYAFHDRATVAAGAASLDDVALTVRATVVSRPRRIGRARRGEQGAHVGSGPAPGHGTMLEAPRSDDRVAERGARRRCARRRRRARARRAGRHRPEPRLRRRQPRRTSCHRRRRGPRADGVARRRRAAARADGGPRHRPDRRPGAARGRRAGRASDELATPGSSPSSTTWSRRCARRTAPGSPRRRSASRSGSSASRCTTTRATRTSPTSTCACSSIPSCASSPTRGSRATRAASSIPDLRGAAAGARDRGRVHGSRRLAGRRGDPRPLGRDVPARAGPPRRRPLRRPRRGHADAHDMGRLPPLARGAVAEEARAIVERWGS